MTDTPTPANGNDVSSILQPRRDPPSDKFGLAVLVTRLQADVAVLRESVDRLESADDAHDKNLAVVQAEVEGLKDRFGELRVEIQKWHKASVTAGRNVETRLHSLESRVSGAAGMLVLVEVAVQAWRASHGV